MQDNSEAEILKTVLVGPNSVFAELRERVVRNLKRPKNRLPKFVNYSLFFQALEAQMGLEKERQKVKRKEEKKQREEQDKILGKAQSRPKLSFALKFK